MARKIPVSVSAPIASAITLGVIGSLAIAAGLPWLFASLGPSIAIQSGSPRQPMARPWNVAVGHFTALGTGYFAVYTTGAVHAPGFLGSNPLVGTRVAAAALAIALGMGLEFALRASHPPGAATTLLIALGVVDANWHTAATFACGIALITLFGEAVRRARLRLDHSA